MIPYRIPEDQWKSHDFKKLAGFLLLLVAAAISHFFLKGPESLVASVDAPPVNAPAIETPPVNVPEVNAPAASVAEVNAPETNTPPSTPPEILFTLTSVKNGDSIKKGDNVFSGTAKPGTVVLMKIDKYVVGKTTATEEGKWSIPRFVHSAIKARKMRAEAPDLKQETPVVSVNVD